jgi:beta-lactam-binding protein with PASTA domain
MSILRQITHRPLWFNMLVAILLAIVLFLLFVLSLKLLTHHGRSRTVPSVVGKTYAEASAILEKEGFDIEIQDSIFVDTLKPTVILKQVPEPDAVVKVNRLVYLTVNRSVPPMVDMPNLIGYSYRNAELSLQNVGLGIQDTIYKSDFARNSVLDMLYQGQSIKAGTKIQMGQKISLVLGSGVGELQFNVPNIVGLLYGEAKMRLEANGVNLLVLSAPGITDSANAYITSQNPRKFDETGKPQKIRTGQMISVTLGAEKPVPVDTTSAPVPDQQQQQQ